VKIFSATGEFDCVVAGPASFSNPNKSPEAVESGYGGLDGAVDAAGRVHVLDLVSLDIQVFAPRSGTQKAG
jgi:hypothetical protein